MSQQHFLISREPVQRWATTIQAICGKYVGNPVPVSMSLIARDLGREELPDLNSLRDCAKCHQIAAQEARLEKDRLWIYGIASGQELKTEDVA